MNLPGYGDPATWPRCTGHPNDPRTEDGPDRYEWEADNSPVDYMDSTELDEILSELLHGNPETARSALDKAVEARFEQWIADEERQTGEDIAAARAEARADDRYWEAA